MAENPTSPRIAFPVTLKRDVRKIKNDLYNPDYGLVADVKHIKRRVESLFWVAVGTLCSVALGVLVVDLHSFGL